MKIHKVLANATVARSHGSKARFHGAARKMLRAVASDLRLNLQQVEIGTFMDKPQTGGHSCLRSPRLHLRIDDTGPGGVLGVWYRTSTGSSDRTGGPPNWISFTDLSSANSYSNFLNNLRLIVGLRIDRPRLFAKRHYETVSM